MKILSRVSFTRSAIFLNSSFYPSISPKSPSLELNCQLVHLSLNPSPTLNPAFKDVCVYRHFPLTLWSFQSTPVSLCTGLGIRHSDRGPFCAVLLLQKAKIRLLSVQHWCLFLSHIFWPFKTFSWNKAFVDLYIFVSLCLFFHLFIPLYLHLHSVNLV